MNPSRRCATPARRPGGVAAFSLASLLLGAAAGCSSKQDFRVLPFERRNSLLRENVVVVEGRVTSAITTFRPTLGQSLLFFVPTGVGTDNPHHDTTITVERVLRGGVQTPTITLRDRRALTAGERAMFRDPPGLNAGSRVRVGYDGRRGGRLRDLAIVPLADPIRDDGSAK